jgi:hypothetical protein
MHATPFGGAWYPAEPGELAALLDELWRKSEERTGGGLLPGARAFVVPHAGLIYSGTVAAAAYRHLERQQPDTVIVAGFAHKGAPAGIWIPEIDGYRTPLGEVSIDAELAGRLVAAGPFRWLAESRLCDHSVEIQLPLLQKAAPRARVLPLYVSELDLSSRQAAAARLAECLGPDTVLIASSDLTHFGSAFGYLPFPADGAVSERLRHLDAQVMEAAGSLRDEFFRETLRESSATVCGHEPIALLLATMQRSEQDTEIFQEVLDYQTSGEISGDFHHSVSYGALGYFPYRSFELDEPAERAVLDLARRTLNHYQQTGREEAPDSPTSGLPQLERRASLFVTLHKEGKLRGCLGRNTPDKPLEQSVPELTLAAALEDSRFDPVSRSETGLEIEVSILSPMKRITQLGDFRVGEHGALLKTKGRQGLLLPQVATERNWDAGQFFQALGLKAGAGQSATANPSARIYVFRAQIIH